MRLYEPAIYWHQISTTVHVAYPHAENNNEIFFNAPKNACVLSQKSPINKLNVNVNTNLDAAIFFYHHCSYHLT